MTRFIYDTCPPASAAPLQTGEPRKGVQRSMHAIDAAMRRRRSPAYMDALARLDAGGPGHDPVATQALQEAIRRELPEVPFDAQALGIIARCHLGGPYEVHTLDCVGNVVQHYKTGEQLPALMERARQLAIHPGYAFIEIYASRIVAVSASGRTAVIEG